MNMNHMSTQSSPSSSISSQDNDQSLSAGKLGMTLFLISFSVLFVASLTAYFIVRINSSGFPPNENENLPAGLWVSTLILLLSSGTIHWALKSVRRDNQKSLRTGMLITLILGYGFLISQGFNWYVLFSSQITASSNLFAFTFYMLTGLHAVHMIGGIILLWVVTTKSFKNVYSSHYYPGVLYSVMYWHFLDIVWLIIFSVMFFGI